MYEIMNPGKDQELASLPGESYTYTMNKCYQLQACQQKNTATGHVVGDGHRGSGEVYRAF